MLAIGVVRPIPCLDGCAIAHAVSEEGYRLLLAAARDAAGTHEGACKAMQLAEGPIMPAEQTQQADKDNPTCKRRLTPLKGVHVAMVQPGSALVLALVVNHEGSVEKTGVPATLCFCIMHR